MKIKPGFVLRIQDGVPMVIPLNTEENMAGVITLNEVGAFLWQQLEQGATCDGLREALLARYDVDAATAQESAEDFAAQLRECGFLDE